MKNKHTFYHEVFTNIDTMYLQMRNIIESGKPRQNILKSIVRIFAFLIKWKTQKYDI